MPYLETAHSFANGGSILHQSVGALVEILGAPDKRRYGLHSREKKWHRKFIWLCMYNNIFTPKSGCPSRNIGASYELRRAHIPEKNMAQKNHLIIHV